MDGIHPNYLTILGLIDQYLFLDTTKNIIVEFILQNNIGYFINDDKSFSELFDRLISKRNNFSRLENYSKQSFVDRFHETKWLKGLQNYLTNQLSKGIIFEESFCWIS